MTFDAGHAHETAGLRFADSAKSALANPALTAFASFRAALDAAEANADAADTVLLATGPIPLDNRAVGLSLGVGKGFVNSVPVTQSLTLRGDGAGVTVIAPTADTQFDDGTGAVADEFTAIVRVDGSAAVLTASGFTLDGVAHKSGAGFAIQNGASAAFGGVTVAGVAFGASGAAVAGNAAKSLTFANGNVTGYGRVGLLFVATAGSVSGSSVVGRGAGASVTNGVELQGGAAVSVTGSRVTANSGVAADGSLGSGLLVTEGSKAFAVGNTFTDNGVALNVGATAPDSSTLDAAFNTISRNDYGAFGGLSIATQDLARNWWGDASGPADRSSPGGGRGDAIDGTATLSVRPFLSYPTPQVSVADASSFAAAQADYLRLVTTLGVVVNPVGPANLTAAPSSVSFAVAVPVPVAANTVTPAALRPLQASDFAVTGPAGFTTALTGSGTSYTLTVGGLTGTNYAVTAALPARAAIDPATGRLTAASNTATATVAVPNAAPTITAVPDQTLSATDAPMTVRRSPSKGWPYPDPILSVTTAALPFTVGDDTTPAAGLTVTAASSNPAAVPASAITLGGTGASRTVTVAGPFAQPGTSTVTLTVTDAQGLKATQSFVVTVANAPPTITAVPDQTLPANGGTAALPFTVGDDTTPAAGLTVTAASSNPAAVPASAITLGGTGASRTVTLANLPGTPGASEITVRVTDAQGQFVSISFGVTVTSPPLPPVTAPPVAVAPKRTRLFAVAADAGGRPEVQVFDANGKPTTRFLAFAAGFTGGVRVATADFDGDGTDDIVVAAGPGGGPHVRVVSGATGAELASFFAFDPSFRGGVFVAAADLTGGGTPSIVVAAGAGGGPHVKVVALNGVASQSFFAFDAGFTGGVTVAAADLDGDGRAEVVVAAGAGGGPHVKAFTVASGVPAVTQSYFAFDAGFTGGVSVAAGTFGVAAAQGVGGTGEVRLLNGGTFPAYAAGFTGGVRLGAIDLGGDGVDEILTAAGPGGGPHVRAFTATGTPAFGALAFDKLDPTGYFIG